MAGLGFKDFAVGEVLTAADVDGYLMQQTVMRFADAGARGSALGTATGTGVPLAEGMVTYLDDVNQVQVFDGTAWAATGKVLQVVSTTKTDTFTTTSTTFTAITGLTASITPQLATNKILVVVSLNANNDVGVADAMYQLMRGATAISIGDAASSRTRASGGIIGVNNSGIPSFVTVHLDSPATTSSTTYSVEVLNTSAGTLYVNRTKDDSNISQRARVASSITLIEVAA